ncbi:MAG: alanine--tRNA ligase [Alphaproteobacteria bacterium]
MMKDIRKTFLNYFERNAHHVAASSSLIPDSDPSLMFVNSGMVQFKNIFLGLEKRDYKTATTAQKCVRAGGKHNDLDNVGYTARHHSFFEMLGNFSFGDYFKEQAIYHAWQVIRYEFNLPIEKLCVTIYHDDDDAFQFWKKIAGFSDEKIIRIKTNDNFWQMGDVGPCGPCSEIFYDHGDKVFGGLPGSKDGEGDRFVEIWNLVFMQYEIKNGGKRFDLPEPSIDTGMGLERMAAVIEGVHNNYDTHLFKNIIDATADILHKKPDEKNITSFRVIADHLRAMAFLIADGILPSNDGRGYVLRRIMRRAMRHAYLLGNQKPLFAKLLNNLIEMMGEHYTELKTQKENITIVFLREEKQFEELLWRGMGLLNKEKKKLAIGQNLSGEIAFKLYDTFGFPLDLTLDIMHADGYGIEMAGFDKAMDEQKKRGKESWVGSGDSQDIKIWFDLKEKYGETKFLGYDRLESTGKILALVDDTWRVVNVIDKDNQGWVVLDQTPFYGEAGGQKGDKGSIGPHLVYDTKKYQGLIAHQIIAVDKIKIGDDMMAVVDKEFRQKLRGHHSATHLLHEALRQELGLHVMQKGSLVSDDHLRFDFSHHQAIDNRKLKNIEEAVNNKIIEGGKVKTGMMDKPTAEKLGVIALFGEKYSETVRVVFMGKAIDTNADNERKNYYSIELCGGTHVKNLEEIDGFMLDKEESIASGVRRIIAYSGGEEIREQMWKKFDKMEDKYNSLLTKCNDLRKKLNKNERHQDDIKRDGAMPHQSVNGFQVFKARNFLQKNLDILSLYEKNCNEIADENKKLTKELSDKKIAVVSKLLMADGEKHSQKKFLYLGKKIDDVSSYELKSIIDNLNKQIDFKDSIIVLLTIDNGKVALAIAVSEAVDGYDANELAKWAGNILGGSGGGKKYFAMAGGIKIDKAEEVLLKMKQKILNS